jgi:hypothetical protein
MIDAVAEGFSETNTGTENALILRDCANRGNVFIKAGDYPLENFQLDHGDYITGSGYNTHITSSGESPIIFGIWSGDSFNDGISTYSVIETPSRNDTTFEFTTGTDSDNYQVGDPVVIWSEDKYTDKHGHDKPALVHVSEVSAVSSGKITIQHPLYRSVPNSGTGPSEMRITSDAQMKGYSTAKDSRFAKDVTLSNMSFSCDDISWSRYGGALRANVSNIWVRDSASIFVQNGIAHSNFSFKRSHFQNFALDMASGCQHTSVHFDEAICINSKQTDNPLVTFGECCHSNYAYAKYIAMTDDSVTRASAIKFARGTADNVFEGKLYVKNSRRLVRYHTLSDIDKLAWNGTRGNEIRNATISADTSSFLLSIHSQTPGVEGRFKASNSVIESSDNNTTQFYISSSNVDISGTRFIGAGSVEINAACKKVDIRNVICKITPSENKISPAAQVRDNGLILGDDNRD